MSTTLYRHFDEEGALLYVGISLSWPARTKAHARGSRWFDRVARVEIERFPTRDEALIAERDAIKAEHPKFNIVHNGAGPAKASVQRRPREIPFADRWVEPMFQLITGSNALVGPALVYRDDLISVMVAHGELGAPGQLSELVLGPLAVEVPAWAEVCDTVLTINKAGALTMAEARDARATVVRTLRLRLDTVEAYDTDIALAVANASHFPSAKARQILDEIAVERGDYFNHGRTENGRND